MPQLDKLIVLPQIFWLMISFTFFYFLITFYFLPVILKLIKSKKYFLNNNNNLNLNLSSNIFEKRKFLMSVLFKDFSSIKIMIFNRILNLEFNFKYNPFKQKYKKLINIILIASINSIFYCNLSLLKSLKFFPLILNKKK